MKNEFLIGENNVDKRMDIFLTENVDLSRSQIKLLVDEKKVFLNGLNVKAGYLLRENDKVEIEYEQTKPMNLKPQNIQLDIVFEDENLAVINKPHGMVVHPAIGNRENTLVNALLYHFKNLSSSQDVRPGIVHRLDKDTSGLMLVAKNNKAHDYLAKQIKDKIVVRHYLALVSGHMPKQEGEIITGFGRDKKNRKKMAVYPLGEGKEAITKYKVVKYFEGCCLVEFVLQTGRTHQIRVHSSHLGHAIVGDALYGGNNKIYSGGQLLHSYKIEFFPYNSNEKLSFEIPLPDYFAKVVGKQREIC